MGVKLHNEDQAIRMSPEIPRECRMYISHHVRNGLVSIWGIAMRIKEDPGALKELEDHIHHISGDLKKVGL